MEKSWFILKMNAVNVFHKVMNYYKHLKIVNGCCDCYLFCDLNADTFLYQMHFLVKIKLSEWSAAADLCGLSLWFNLALQNVKQSL